MPSRRVIIDHVSVGVANLERSREFYLRVLEPLGFTEFGAWKPGTPETSFGADGENDFGLSEAYPATGSVHIAFAADSFEQVDAFHAAALAAGATDNGPPGPRTDYSPGYYGAFVIDPDGNNIEAVFHSQG